MFICWTSVIWVGQPCRFLCRVASAMVCPSNLGECSLVRLLFFQNLHWVFGYGLQCLGPEELSGISFADFQHFKNLSTPVLALFQGAFSQNFGNFKSCDISLFFKTSYNWVISKLLLSVKIYKFCLNRHPGVTIVLTLCGKLRFRYSCAPTVKHVIFTPCEFGEWSFHFRKLRYSLIPGAQPPAHHESPASS